MTALGIVAFCVLSAVVYGILHDQVTARVCLEYFTVFHAPVFNTQSPTLLGIGWGIIATWWVGLFLGVLLAVAARVGKRPKVGLRELVKPVIRLMAVVGALALVFGVVGYFAAEQGWVGMSRSWAWAQRIPEARHTRFLADLWAHNASYAFGFLGGAWLCVRTYRSRKVLTPTPSEWRDVP